MQQKLHYKNELSDIHGEERNRLCVYLYLLFQI